MKEFLKEKVKEFVFNDEFNKHDFSNGLCFDDALVGVASINDPIFNEFKTAIGKFHMTPRESFEDKFGEGSLNEGSVIAISLPIGEYVRKSNRKEKTIPSKQWTLMRSYGNDYEVAKYLLKLLNDNGNKVIIPAMSNGYQIFSFENDISSNWSERHIAYATGLGTFGLNQALITDKGIANRIVSLVTDLVIEPDERKSSNHNENCLYYFNGKCKACRKRCPINAISEEGIDKYPCREKAYGDEAMKLAISRGAIAENGSGCGLCQTGTPCEHKNPVAILKSKNMI